MEEKEELKKVQTIAQSYYARKDVQNAIYEFCKNMETVPRYLDIFGKRPEVLDYASDVFNFARKGATSFHCSEELWENPLKISSDMKVGDYNNLRIGWNFLIDIDSKYFDYSKIAARLLIKALEYHGVKNVGVKFSGSKGMHIIIPWKAFPKEVAGEKTKDRFPEWPRLIAEYLNEMIHDKLSEEILKISNKEELEKKGKQIEEFLCPRCKKPTVKKVISKYVCRNFKCRSEIQSMKSTRKKLRCPSCNYDVEKAGEEEIYFCADCNINSAKMSSIGSYGGNVREIDIKNSEFKKKLTTKSLIDSVDIVLVSPRHLFRAPYSLHEKTAFASVVIDKNEVENFHPSMADPLKVSVKNYLPECEENEARELLLQALDWAKKKGKIEKKFTGKSIDVKNLKITEDMFPDCIKKILDGQKEDGRKRALFVLLSFFSSLDFPQNYIESKIYEWNKKNYQELKEGYIQGQISWFSKNKIMPPNCDKPFYKELGVVCSCKGIKNPINFTIREALKRKK